MRGYPKRKFEFAILVCKLLCTKLCENGELAKMHVWQRIGQALPQGLVLLKWRLV